MEQLFWGGSALGIGTQPVSLSFVEQMFQEKATVSLAREVADQLIDS